MVVQTNDTRARALNAQDDAKETFGATWEADFRRTATDEDIARWTVAHNARRHETFALVLLLAKAYRDSRDKEKLASEVGYTAQYLRRAVKLVAAIEENGGKAPDWIVGASGVDAAYKAWKARQADAPASPLADQVAELQKRAKQARAVERNVSKLIDALGKERLIALIQAWGQK